MNNKEKDTIQLNKTKLRALLPAIKKLNGFLTKTAPGKCKINADADFDEEFMKGCLLYTSDAADDYLTV